MKRIFCILLVVCCSALVVKGQGYFTRKGVEGSVIYAFNGNDFNSLGYRIGIVAKDFSIGFNTSNATQGALEVKSIGPDIYYTKNIKSKIGIQPYISYKSRTYSGTYNGFVASGNGSRFTAGVNVLIKLPLKSTNIDPVIGALWFSNSGSINSNNVVYRSNGNFTALYGALRIKIYQLSLFKLGVLPEVYYGNKTLTYGINIMASLGLNKK
jgi:hypothetical protein